jgi:hypothetical protein
MSGDSAGLYDRDFVRWAEEQAAALRAAAGLGTDLPLDWENLAEEIDSLGRSQRRELRSRIAVVIEHLLKLECSLATDSRPGWIDTIGREPGDIEDLLADSPSLKSEVAGMIGRETPKKIRLVVRSLRERGETATKLDAEAGGIRYAEEQVLGDWFPGDPPLPADRERG